MESKLFNKKKNKLNDKKNWNKFKYNKRRYSSCYACDPYRLEWSFKYRHEGHSIS
jgi:hypothetical protein